MSKMPWFRAYTEMIDDEKLRLLAFEDRWHFMAILCLKGQGVLDVADPLMMRKVAVKMGLDLRTLEEVTRRLAEVGLIDQLTLEPLKWEDRQMRSDTDSTAADRKRRQREREKSAAEVAGKTEENQCHEDVTDESRVTVTDVTRTEEDIDKEEDKDKEEKIKEGAVAPSASPKKSKTKNSKPSGTVSAEQLRAEGVDRQVAEDWLKVRRDKKQPLTATAWEVVKSEAAKAHMSVADAVRMAAENSWAGFKSSWSDRVKAESGGASAAQDGLAWLGSWPGIISKGNQLGLKQEPNEMAPHYKIRVVKAAKLTPEQIARARADFGVNL